MQMDQQTEYLMWVKSKDLMMNSYKVQSQKSSWEEEAFAEDIARGPLGGFVWPPRSYSCSFCKREFRSAQALGGHMNVHRRERASLKQSSLPKSFESPSLLNPSLVLATCSSLSPSSSRASPALGRGNGHEHDHDHDQNGVELTNFFVDGLDLDLEFSRRCLKNWVDVDVDEEMEEIDLELRLGDSPKMK